MAGKRIAALLIGLGAAALVLGGDLLLSAVSRGGLSPVMSIATVEEGTAGLTGSTAPAKDDKTNKDEAKKDEPKKGFGLGALKPAAAPERQTAQVPASGGSRGLGPDRAAKGGGNPAIVKASVTDADLATFKKGIA